MNKVSIIVPVYNLGDYLTRCIKSILSQVFRDFELFLIDDGSIDNSGKICEYYAINYSRVFIIHMKNEGVSVARNIGMLFATSEYISFIDGDDWISPFYLERLYNSCEETKAQMAICEIKHVDCEIIEPMITAPNNVLNNLEAIEKLGTLMDARFRSSYAKLVKASIIRNHLFPTDRSYAEDAACVYLWMYDCERIVEISEIHYYYYQRSDSIVHLEYNWHRLFGYQTFEEMLDFFSCHNMDNPYYAALCKYLHEMMDGYERCVILNKSDISNTIQKNLAMVLQDKLNYTIIHKLEYRENLLPILYKNNQMLFNRYLSDCCYGLYLLYNQTNNKTIKHHIKFRIKKIIKQYCLSIEDYSFVFELAYPQKMGYVWKYQALKRKLLKR